MSPVGSKRRPYVLRDHEHAMSTLGLIRDERGMSYPRLAAMVNATRQQVGEWLRCWTMPASQRLFEMAHALGYDVALVPREDVPNRADCGCPVFHRQARVEEHTAECSERKAAERFAASVSREMAWEGE